MEKAHIAEAGNLSLELTTHSYNYHTLDNPTIPDIDYDQLFRRLQELEGLYPKLVHENSPTVRVGSPTDEEGLVTLKLEIMKHMVKLAKEVHNNANI